MNLERIDWFTLHKLVSFWPKINVPKQMFSWKRFQRRDQIVIKIIINVYYGAIYVYLFNEHSKENDVWASVVIVLVSMLPQSYNEWLEREGKETRTFRKVFWICAFVLESHIKTFISMIDKCVWEKKISVYFHLIDILLTSFWILFTFPFYNKTYYLYDKIYHLMV